MTRRGCGCCGGGLTIAACCSHCNFENATVSNLLITNTSTSETFTQSGASVYDGPTNTCRMNIPVTSSVTGAETATLTWAVAGYSGTLDLRVVGRTTVMPKAWNCEDSGTISGSASVFTYSYDIATTRSCGCCGTCPYEYDAITNFTINLGHSQTGASDILLTSGITSACKWRINATGGNIYYVVKSGTSWSVQDFTSTGIATGTLSTCSGTVSFTGFPSISGSFDVTSSGTCPT